VIREFSIKAAHVLNRGNYESLRIECELVVIVPEGDDYQVLVDKAQTELRKLLEETYRRQAKPNGA
jgi:UDP-N-acetylglucosamine transferase subunit ALG13